MENKKNDKQIPVLRNEVYQSNPLIQARKDFDVIGMRVFFLGLSGINPHFSDKDKYYDAEFNRMFIPTSKITELFGGNTKYLSELRKTCTKLFDSIVELNYADGGFKLMHIFEELEYKPKEGLYLQFSRKMRPYILDLFESKGYTRINVEYLFKLSSPYAVRILELLIQYQNIKQFKEMMEIKRKFTMEELRFVLNVPVGAYAARMDNFRRYVLDDPIREINERTPYIVRYETVKEGRKVVAFEFTLDTYRVPIGELNGFKPQFGNDAIHLLRSLGFDEKTARAIFKKCESVEDCFSRIYRAQAVLERSKKPVENKLGFLRMAIENDWRVERKRGKEKPSNEKFTSRMEPTNDTDFFNNSMVPIGKILRPRNLAEEDVPDRPQPIKIGRKQMPRTLAETLMKYIRSCERLDNVKELLQEYKTSIEKFTVICEQQGL